MAFSMRVDLGTLRRKVRAVRAQSDAIAKTSAGVVAVAFTRRVLIDGPKDTNRFVRGFCRALNSSGAGTVPVPPLRESNYAGIIRSRLEKQITRARRDLDRAREKVDFWDGAARRTSVGLKGKQRTALNKARREEERAADLVERAIRELAIFDEASRSGQAPLVIFGNTTGRFTTVDGVKRRGAKRRLGITVRGKVYGGVGRYVPTGPGSGRYELHNREPHCRIVESRTRIVSRSIALAKVTGAKEARRLIGADLRKAWAATGGRSA